MKNKLQRLMLFVGLVVFGAGIGGIPSSGIANYDMSLLYASFFDMALGALMIVLTLPFNNKEVKE